LVLAVAAKDITRAQNFAKRHNIETSYGSYEELAHDKSIDVVYVGAIHIDHFRLSMLMLENGKHVLCEKPLCTNADLTKRLFSYARSKKLFLMEAVWSRCFPAYVKLKDLISSGAIGSVNYVNCRFGTAYETPPPRIEKMELAGGGLLDVGIYCVQFSQMVFNEELPIRQTTRGSLFHSGVDGDVNIILEYSNKRSSCLTCSITTVVGTGASIHGTEGYITVGPLFWCPPSIDVFDKRGQKTESFDFPLSPTPPGGQYNFRNSQGLTYEIMQVRECLLKGQQECPLISGAHSIAISEILTQARHDVGYFLPEDKH